MAWQKTLQTALDELERERQRLSSELGEVEDRIQRLQAMTDSPAPSGTRGRSRGQAKKARAKRRMTPEGRAAISRAAKARWAKHRAARKKASEKAPSSKQ